MYTRCKKVANSRSTLVKLNSEYLCDSSVTGAHLVASLILLSVTYLQIYLVHTCALEDWRHMVHAYTYIYICWYLLLPSHGRRWSTTCAPNHLQLEGWEELSATWWPRQCKRARLMPDWRSASALPLSGVSREPVPQWVAKEPRRCRSSILGRAGALEHTLASLHACKYVAYAYAWARRFATRALVAKESNLTLKWSEDVFN